ncbi:MAG: hypothetical protein IJI06_09715 [Oscillospiraceae bacterium]|nr:hypothetical protein [Oscillospiraceae bacterium]
MTMDKAEIAIDYRRAANKQKQIKILAELNQCAERKIAEILVDAGEELPKKWQEQLLKPARRNWKFPEGETSRENAEGEAVPDPEAVDPEPDVKAAPWPVEDPSTAPPRGSAQDDAGELVLEVIYPKIGSDETEQQREAKRKLSRAAQKRMNQYFSKKRDMCALPEKSEESDEGTEGITAERLLREACRLMASALALSPDDYHTYSCGVLDLVHALTEEKV